jgi:hypothetical protein
LRVGGKRKLTTEAAAKSSMMNPVTTGEATEPSGRHHG